MSDDKEQANKPDETSANPLAAVGAIVNNLVDSDSKKNSPKQENEGDKESTKSKKHKKDKKKSKSKENSENENTNSSPEPEKAPDMIGATQKMAASLLGDDDDENKKEDSKQNDNKETSKDDAKKDDTKDADKVEKSEKSEENKNDEEYELAEDVVVEEKEKVEPVQKSEEKTQEEKVEKKESQNKEVKTEAAPQEEKAKESEAEVQGNNDENAKKEPDNKDISETPALAEVNTKEKEKQDDKPPQEPETEKKEEKVESPKKEEKAEAAQSEPKPEEAPKADEPTQEAKERSTETEEPEIKVVDENEPKPANLIQNVAMTIADKLQDEEEKQASESNQYSNLMIDFAGLELDMPSGDESMHEMAQQMARDLLNDQYNDQQNVFETDGLESVKSQVPSILSNSRAARTTPSIIRPRTSQGEYRRTSKGYGIDNYDPRVRRQFTDPLTKQAIKNLGVKTEELFYPTDRDLYAYSRDKNMREIVRKNLVNRVHRTAQMVKEEKERISTLPPTPRITDVRDATIDDMDNRNKVFAQQEKQRMERIKEKNRRNAEQIILSILIEKEMIQETVEMQEKEKLKSQRHKEEVQKKQKEEFLRQLARIKELEEEEIQRRKDNEKKRVEAEEKQKAFEKKKAEADQRKREILEALDRERAKKNEIARKAALDYEEKLRKDYELKQKELVEREKQFMLKKKREQEEREERQRKEEEMKKQKVEAVRTREIEQLNQKKKKTEKKREDQELRFREITEQRMKDLETMRKMNEEKQQEFARQRYERDRQRADSVRSLYLSHLEKSMNYYQDLKTAQEFERNERAIAEQIQREEALAKSHRLAKQKEAMILEEERRYQFKLQQIDQKTEMKRKLMGEAELQRLKLEREKEELVTGLVSPAEIRKKGSGQLEKLAAQLGIDIEDLKQKAKQARRGQKAKEQMRSSLPPMEPRPMTSYS